jgi:hypothetical protein
VNRKSSLNMKFFIPWLLLVLGAVVGLILTPARSTEYLELQAASDNAHRLAIFALPAGVLAALISLAVSIIGRRRNRVRRISRLVMGCALGVVVGVLVYIVSFDSFIEEKGTAGQLVLTDAPPEKIRWKPSLLLEDGDIQYFLGPGYRYEDNLAVVAVDRSSGRLRWIFHCLGNVLLDARIQEGRLAFKTRRPSHTTSYLLDLNEPRVLSFGKE